MITNKDYYSILGVLPSIEASALDAVYKALIKKFHPDVFSGDKKTAEDKTKEINEAYSVLRDPEKRKKYDAQRLNENKGFCSFEQNNNFEYDNSTIINQLKSDWDIVIDFIPNAEKNRIILDKLSASLSLSYQLKLIIEKLYDKHDELAKHMRSEFLKSYFGDDAYLENFAEKLIIQKNRDAANYLNNIIRVMGSPKKREDAYLIEDKIRKKFNLPITGLSKWETSNKHNEESYSFYNKDFDFSKLRN